MSTKSSVRIVAALTSGISLLMVPQLASAAEPPDVSVTNLRGPLVNANFTSADPSGCIITDVSVAANSGTEQNLPDTEAFGVASVSIYRHDDCTGATLVDAGGLVEGLPSGEFQVSNQLDQASLNTTIQVSDLVSGDSYPVAVDVVWSGQGPIHRAHDNTNDRYSVGCHVVTRWKGTGREALAVGEVSFQGQNVTPATSVTAEIGWVIDGFEVIGCL